MNILVTGKNGQLGSEFQELSSDNKSLNFYFTDIEDLDITDFNQIKEFFKFNKIDLIINCAAYTAVDKAEEEKVKADTVNNLAVGNLVKICLKFNIKLIHISTDYVFDGNKKSSYKENDKTNPIGTYGLSKRLGEKQILNSRLNAIIIRTSWLYSSYGNNFVKTIIRLGQVKKSINVVNDQFGSPTYAKDLAYVCIKIIENIKIWSNNPEIFHYSNEGQCTWYDFAKKITNINQISLDIIPVISKNYSVKTKRPMYSVLNKEKIKSRFNINIPQWDHSLNYCLKIIKSKI